MSLNVQTSLIAPSDRVKSVDYHPTQPWILTGLISGVVEIRNYETQALVVRWQVTNAPVRTAKFIAHRNWIVAGADDRMIRVFDITSATQVAAFEAHKDYIRYIDVHASQSKIVTCADDHTIKVWDWERSWECIQEFQGHDHYVMMARFHPTDIDLVASASLDKSIRFWSMSTGACVAVLEGHTRGINCLAFDATGVRLVSGADDHSVRIWDVKTRSELHQLEGHTANVTATVFHPHLPVVVSASEDGAVRVWDTTSLTLQATVVQGLARAWAVTARQTTNAISVGYDGGMVELSFTPGQNICPQASRL